MNNNVIIDLNGDVHALVAAWLYGTDSTTGLPAVVGVTGDAAHVISKHQLSIMYFDATYDYFCSGTIGSSRTDPAWIITRIEKAATKATDYAGLSTRVMASNLATVAAHTYNNGVSI